VADKKLIKNLGEWEGYTVVTVGWVLVKDSDSEPEVWIELFPEKRPSRCRGCWALCERMHDMMCLSVG